MTDASPADLTGRRLLVVEDEYFIADDIARAIRQMGGEVVGPVARRNEAMALIERERLDAAVLDINLQGEAAFQLADALVAKGVPFLFSTGYTEATVPSRYGGVPRWEKPFNPDDLARALPALLLRR
jgi:two-component SAPR family response regulator